MKRKYWYYFCDRWGYIVLALPVTERHWVENLLGGRLMQDFVSYGDKVVTPDYILFYVINNFSLDTPHPEDFATGGYFKEKEGFNVKAYNQSIALDK